VRPSTIIYVEPKTTDYALDLEFFPSCENDGKTIYVAYTLRVSTGSIVKKTSGVMEPFSGSDVLSHFNSQTGQLTTEAGTEFLIPGEKWQFGPVSRWKGSATQKDGTPLRFSCDAQAKCTIENRWNGETVTAELLRMPPPPFRPQ
jgi:hypothetical protein